MKHYAKRDPLDLMNYYIRHIFAMTAEGLHEKSDIAAELAWRDKRIEEVADSFVLLLMKNSAQIPDHIIEEAKAMAWMARPGIAQNNQEPQS